MGTNDMEMAKLYSKISELTDERDEAQSKLERAAGDIEAAQLARGMRDLARIGCFVAGAVSALTGIFIAGLL